MRVMKKTIVILIASAPILWWSMIASAQGVPGGVGGIGAGGFTSGGIAAPGLSPNNMVVPNLPGPQQRFRQLKLAGRIPTDPAKEPAGARIVRLSVNGEIVPMALDTETTSGELQFDPGDSNYGRQLYQAILTKPITVVGDERLRSEITEAASNTANPRVLKIDGYVFDRLSPYMVVRSVEDAN